MTKPDFSQMTRQELRTYILAHRDDDEAIAALIQRGNPNGAKYPYPQTPEDVSTMTEILRHKLDQNHTAA